MPDLTRAMTVRYENNGGKLTQKIILINCIAKRLRVTVIFPISECEGYIE